ncbi:MAG: hypothetical protein KatS3mg065_0076 [Chloroflexota bacterium]|nr:MAG: hypothetical protein KatS3mg065_0076 [Chloroflexota bacterium]
MWASAKAYLADGAAGQAYRRSAAVVAVLAASLALAGCLPATTTRQFGVLVSTDPTAGTVTFREATLFTGDEAAIEAARDGRQVGGPFYVRLGSQTRTLALAPDANVVLLGYDSAGDFSPVPADAATFLHGSPLRDATPYYWFDLDGDRIVGVAAVESP